MDVRLPNGRIITNVPEGTTQTQLREILTKNGISMEVERPLTDVIRDVPYQVAGGLGAVIKDAGTLAGMVVPGGTVDNPITRLGEWQQENARSGLSASYKAREAELDANVEQATQEGGQLAAMGATVKGLVKDPILTTGKFVEQIPQLLPGAAAGMATKAAMLMRGVAPTKKAIMTAVIGMGATQQSADVAGDVYDESRKQGLDPETAKARATQAFIASMPASIASQFIAGQGGRSFERVLGGVEGRQMGAKSFVKAIIGEPISEMAEETTGKQIVNIQARRQDPTISPYRGVGRTAGEAGVLGAGYGVIGGTREAIGAPREDTTSKTLREDVEALRAIAEAKNKAKEAAFGEQIYDSYKKDLETDAQTQQNFEDQVFKDYLQELPGGPQLELDFSKKRKTRSDKGKKRQQELVLEQPQEAAPQPNQAARIVLEGTPTLPFRLILGDDRKASTSPQAVINWLKSGKDMQGAPAGMKGWLGSLATDIEPYLPPGLRIEILPSKGFQTTFRSVGGQGAPAGFFVAPHNTIYMDMGSLDASTLMHEMVHAATEYAIGRWKDPLTQQIKPGAPPAIVALNTLYTELKSKADKVSGSQYGFKDLSEFIAEAFSNPNFQAYLATQPIPGQTKSMWRGFIEYVTELLGMAPEKANSLGAALSIGKQAMEYQKQELGMLMKYTLKVWPKAMHAQVKSAVNEQLEGDIAIDELAESGEVTIVDEATAQDKVFEKLGIETGRIPDDPNVEDKGLIERILQDTDGSAKWDWAYPGALQAADIRQSTLIRTIYRLMDNAYKRAKKFERDFIIPLENTWSKLLRNRQSTQRLLAVFKMELAEDVEFTPEELARILKPNEVMAYKDMRDVLDLAMKEQNKALVAVGLKEVTRLDSYYAARWRGPYRSVIRNKDGKVVWVIAERTMKQAKKAQAWIKQRHPELEMADPTYFQGHEQENKLQAGYLELLKMLDMDDPDSRALHEAWKENMLSDTEDVLGQEKHFKRKSGVQGFAGARPWADSYEDAKEFFIEQIKYLKAAAQWSAMQVPASKAKDLLTNSEVAKAQPNNVKYAKAYLRNHLGYSTVRWIDQAEKAVAAVFGRDTEFSENILGGMKSLFYVMQLGYNMAYSLYAAVQPTLGAGKHALFTSDGYHHNMGKTTALAFTDGMAFSLAHLGNYISHTFQDQKSAKLFGETMNMMFRKVMTENGKIATDYIEANGVVDVTPATDIMDLRVPAWVGKARSWGGWTISAVEIMSRSMAFYSFVHHLAQSDKRNLTTDDILIMADDATKDIMADYRPAERALMFNQAGQLGKGLATLQTFKFNWMAQVLKYYKLGKDKGQWRPFVMQMSAYFLLAGMAGFIGIDDADDIWRYVLSQLPDSEFAKWKNYSPKNLAMRSFGNLVSYGAISGITGTNLYTRGSLGDIFPANPNRSLSDNLLNFFPFLSTGWNALYGGIRGGMELAGVGNRDENMAAVLKGMPAAAKGPFEVMSNQYESPTGVALSLQDMSLGAYRRTDADRDARMWGLRTLRETQAMEGRYRHRDLKIETDKRRGRAGNDFWSAALKGDNRHATEYLTRYIELGGDPRNLLSYGRATEAYKRLALDYLEQLMVKVKPGNRAAVREYIEYMMFYAPTE